MRHIPNKKGICAHIFNVRALDAKQMINFFLPNKFVLSDKKWKQLTSHNYV